MLRWLLYAFLFASVGISIWMAVQRFSWEASYQRVGLAISSQELDAFAEDALREHLDQWRAQGVVALTIELSDFPDWGLHKIAFGERLFRVIQLADEVGLALALVVEAADAAAARQSVQALTEALGLKPQFVFIVATTAGTTSTWTPSELEEILSNSQALVGAVEFSEPEGLLALYREGWHGFVRVHAIKVRELDRLGLAGALARWERAVQERNIRLLWVMEHKRFPTYLERLSQQITASGFKLGWPALPAPFENSALVYFVIGLGIVSLLVLVAANLLRAHSVFLISFGVIGIGVVVLAGAWNLAMARQFLALTLALLAPWSVLALCKERLSGVLLLLAVSVSSVAAGLGIAALLSDETYFLKLDEFRGVKIALVAPSLVAIALELLRGGRWDFLKAQLKRGAWLAPAVGLGALFLVLERSGNLPLIPVGRWEELLRERLEDWLIARPRFKEFLIGHPALLLLGTYRSGSASFVNLSLLALGVLGQASIINTFAHLHTPLGLSLWRTLNGLVIGALVGGALIGGLNFLKWLRRRRS